MFNEKLTSCYSFNFYSDVRIISIFFKCIDSDSGLIFSDPTPTPYPQKKLVFSDYGSNNNTYTKFFKNKSTLFPASEDFSNSTLGSEKKPTLSPPAPTMTQT